MRSIPVLLTPAATPATATFTSGWIDAGLITHASLQSVVSGGTSIVGTLKLQGSNDIAAAANMPQVPPGPTHWNDIPNELLSEVASALTYTVAISGNVSTLLPVTRVGYRWLRAVYTYTSGTGGTIAIVFHGTETK